MTFVVSRRRYDDDVECIDLLLSGTRVTQSPYWTQRADAVSWIATSFRADSALLVRENSDLQHPEQAAEERAVHSWSPNKLTPLVDGFATKTQTSCATYDEEALQYKESRCVVVSVSSLF